MKILKRSLIAVIRQPVKSSIFLLIVILLSALSAGSIIVHQAIISTDQVLRKQMPAIVNVSLDSLKFYEETGEWPFFTSVPPDTIRYLGQSELVRLYDYSIDMRWGVTASGFVPWLDPDFPHIFGMDYHEKLGVNLWIEGVSNAEFIDVRSAFVELIAGRSFEANELEDRSEITPVIVSQGFATTNNLSIGSEFSAQVVVFDRIDLGTNMIENFDEPPLIEVDFPLVIIGIFEPILPNFPENMELDDQFVANRWQSVMKNRFFVPSYLAEEMFQARSTVDSPGNESIWIQNFFWLEDPDYFDDFSNLVSSLGGEWIVNDFSSGFRNISSAMRQLQDIANGILTGATIMTVTVIVLAVLLFLKERKQEIGIYLALGEAKNRISFQMLLELLPLILIGMTLALFIGLWISNILSNIMIINHIAEYGNHFLELDAGIPLEYFGYRFELNQAEMLEAFSITLDTTIILAFYGLGLFTTILATIIPISYAVKNAPLELLKS